MFRVLYAYRTIRTALSFRPLVILPEEGNPSASSRVIPDEVWSAHFRAWN